MQSHRLQSAMEYLMTYGWAILIIAVVLGALYQLGVFGSGQSGFSSVCITNAGYVCAKPVMNASGVLAVVFGQISGGPLTITNVACTKNLTAPVSTNSVSITAVSGSSTILQFSCPLSSNSIGSSFSGYLWIIYNTQTQSGVLDRIGIVKTKVTTLGSSAGALQSQGGGATSTTSTSTTSTSTTSTTSTSTTSTSTTSTSTSTTTIIYTYNSGEQASHGMSISVGSGNSWICISTPFYDSQTGFPPSGFNYAFDISAAGSPSIGRPASDLCTYSNAGGDQAEGEFALTSPPTPTITTINAIASASQTLNYNVAVSNSFVILAIGCGSGSHNSGCSVTIPASCTQVFNANDGTMNSYGAVCLNAAAGAYSATASYTGTGEYAMAAYVYH